MARNNRAELTISLDISVRRTECGTMFVPSLARTDLKSATLHCRRAEEIMDGPSVQQNIYLFGNSNNVLAAGRDVFAAPLPPSPNRAQPVLAGTLRRRLGKIAGGLALATTLVIGKLLYPPSLSPPSLWPEGKSALCKDGWYSASLHRSGTCSSHGGVAYWRFPADGALSRP